MQQKVRKKKITVLMLMQEESETWMSKYVKKFESCIFLE